MATETDAARDRVLAARAALGEELEVLEASARAAVDIPARVRRNPVKAAAIAGGAGFLVLGGPKRVFRGVKRAVLGQSSPLPESMLPDEIERALRALGDDGDKVRGALERDFAAYAKKSRGDRAGLQRLLILSILRPFVWQASRVAAKRLFNPDTEGFAARLAQVRQRTAGMTGGGAKDPGAVAPEASGGDPGAGRP